MLLRLLFRKETLVLGGVTAAFVMPMFRSGELSAGKIAHWIANGIAATESGSSESSSTDNPLGFGERYSTTSNSLSGIPVSRTDAGDSSDVSGILNRFLNSVFETQTLDGPQDLATITIPQGGAPVDYRLGLLPVGKPPTTAIPQSAPTSDSGSAIGGQTSWLPVNDLREIIRFDVSPYWVQQRWQPATRLDLDSDGYYGFRVPVVTDQRVGTLTGAMTFYFDSKAVVQRIQFLGTVEDPTRIESLLKQYFHFEPVPDRTGLLAPVHRGTARGMLKVSEPYPMEQLGQPTSSSPQSFREIAFEVNSTQGSYKLSETYRQLAIQ